MRSLALLIAATALPAVAMAQLVGVTGAAGGTVGNTVGATTSLGANVRADPAAPIERTTRATTDTTRAASDAATDTTRADSHAVHRAASDGVKVNAGAQVARGERCYDGRTYYDSVYRDGYYYCERTGTAVAVGASVKPPR